tara:strand:+ start:250 stop:462 length:213 start_codon:yes stop_codon:yes gene_type:complete
MGIEYLQQQNNKLKRLNKILKKQNYQLQQKTKSLNKTNNELIDNVKNLLEECIIFEKDNFKLKKYLPYNK